MGDDWVEIKLYEMFDRNLARDIYKNCNKTLTGVSQNGNMVEIFELYENTTKITTLSL